MLKRSFLILMAFSCLVLSGCALTVSEVRVDTSALTLEENETATKTVYVREVTDDRTFNPRTGDPSVPSMTFSTLEEKSRQIGRKRNGYGKALGGFVLAQDQSVTSLSRDTIEQALIDNGYKVIRDPALVTKSTIVLDVSVRKFWAWLETGFWQIKLHSDVIVDVADETKSRDTIKLKGSYAEGFQIGTDSNYIKVIQESFDRLYQDAKRKLKFD